MIPKFNTHSWVKYLGRIYQIQHIEIVGDEVYYDLVFNREVIKTIPEKELTIRD